MKLTLFVVGIVATAIITGNPAKAQNYPWCAQYSAGRTGGGMNCGFVSFDQCMATVRGMGGFCIQNNTYVPPARAASDDEISKARSLLNAWRFIREQNCCSSS